MANISSAEGTITLKGNWTQQAIDAFKPVLNSWEFYGEYGIQDCRNELSLKNKTTDFNGCGRSSFSDTLNSFDDWTRDWIKTNPDENHPLTAEQYDEFLKIMSDKKLKIEITFTYEEEGVDFRLKETGVFTSDGEKLCYKTVSREEEKDFWESLGCESFDAATQFFAQFLINPDRKQLQKWVKAFVLPNDCYKDFQLEQNIGELSPFLERNFPDTPFVIFFDVLYDFMNRFEVNEDDIWSVFEDFISNYYDWYLDDVDEHIKFNLENDKKFDKWYKKLQNQ